MSIRIDNAKCVGCGKCLEVCPGNLIYKDELNRAYIKYKSDCWGCTACLKECKVSAIRYYLGADIGGNGASLYVKEVGKCLDWYILDNEEREVVITTNRNESNKY